MQKQAPARPFQVNPALAHLAASLSNHALRRADVLFLPSEAFLNRLRFPTPNSRPQRGRLESWTRFLPPARWGYIQEEDFLFGAVRPGRSLGRGRRRGRGYGDHGALSSQLLPASPLHAPKAVSDLISHLRAPGCCYFYVTELSRFKLEGDISSLIGTFKGLLSHSAASGLCN